PSQTLAARSKSLAAFGARSAAAALGTPFDGRCIPAPPQRGCRVGDPGGAALLLLHILAVFSVVAPCPRGGAPNAAAALGTPGASPVSVRRQTFTTGWQSRERPFDANHNRHLHLQPFGSVTSVSGSDGSDAGATGGLPRT